MSTELARAAEIVRRHALGMPGAYEDFPWDDSVAKVGKKIFAFLGAPEDAALGLGVKLRESHDEALSMPFVTPMRYGLGRHGWVTVEIGAGDDAPVDLLCDWIDESYRLVATKRLVAELDRRQGVR